MRFGLAHKLSTYLMVAAAYLGLALSGELALPWVTASGLGMALSWFWEPPRFQPGRHGALWSAAALLVLAYTLTAMITTREFVVSGAHFLLFLTVAKLFARRSCRDYLQIYVLSFLMLVAGTVLNAEFTYGLLFLAYVVSSTWALSLFHLRREMEDNFLLRHTGTAAAERVEVARILDSRRIVGRGFFLGTSLVSLAVFATATLLFLFIPRIGFGLFFQRDRSGPTMTGFSDGVELGGHGLIKDDSTVVMRVQTDAPRALVPHIHWRGVAFDHYSRGQWRRSPAAPPTRRRITLRQRRTLHHLEYTGGTGPDRELYRRLQGSVRQEIYLEPLGYDVVFGAAMPLAFEFADDLQTRPRKAQSDEIRVSHTAGIKYTAYSALQLDATRARPAPARRELPPGFAAYLQIPPEVPQRVRALARDITRGAASPYDQAVALERWLKTQLGYTLQMESPGQREPIDFFLFERRRGHCEYFSSAMTILARAVGLPARNVNGFLGGEWNEYDDYVAVRAGDAHSWVEVYVPGPGWLTFDPTPSAGTRTRKDGGDDLTDRMRRYVDTLRFKWFKWVIEYDLYAQLSLFKRVGSSLRSGGSGLGTGARSVGQWLAGKRPRPAALLVVAGVLLTAAWLVRRRRGRGGHRAARDRDRSPLARRYAQVLAQLGRAGYPRSVSDTPREHAAALARRGAPGAAALTEFTEIYYEAEYGQGTSPDRLGRADQLAAEIIAAASAARRGKRS
jgi:transglutaminase-like putative cysteine protease